MPAVKALVLNEGPPKAALSELESSLAERESLKSILTGDPNSRSGRIAWLDALAQQIC